MIHIHIVGWRLYYNSKYANMQIKKIVHFRTFSQQECFFTHIYRFAQRVNNKKHICHKIQAALKGYTEYWV